ncbi:MAG: zinc dependent phospholipase C family protein [Methylophilaceae bacterium]
MRRRNILNSIWWCLPLSLYSFDANAWGLYTHVYFAQTLLLASPLLAKRFRNAIKQFPELVMAGACLPDLAVISKKFKTTHQWQKAEYLINTACTDEETAIAIGYASHLYVDVIAHNHFVPAHEALWQHESILTHIASEWAMDVHIQQCLSMTPGQLLSKYAVLMSHFIAPCFEHPQRFVQKKLIKLANADRLLRLVKLPSIIHRCIQLSNNQKHKHFDYYIGKTQHALRDFHKVLNGHHPNWQPELLVNTDITRITMWRQHCLETLHIDHAEPISYYSAR